MNTLPIVHFLSEFLSSWGLTIERGRHAGYRDSVELYHYSLLLNLSSDLPPTSSQRSRATISREMNSFLFDAQNSEN